MSRPARALCALYSATALFLAYCAVIQCQAGGPLWAVPLFVAASIVPVIATLRELELADERRTTATLTAREIRRLARHDARCEDTARRELDAACCERWWTALGTDHDPDCQHQTPRSNAA
ncbi:hypothetical protein H1V43_32325 [Streptomyces sp. PSKA54]|uniref:Uncharacterized protein n=1 Tax=Streptomyces himalayensis subsp. aureolus TaxID=2758039 RepID=A0A7W2HJC0_9ACTN|nr:hypothetical protein [Streptomyces himalayensis]MBA4865951.1 hypothetical protein [Streptomyces himalayensis subsp. aureolus]